MTKYEILSSVFSALAIFISITIPTVQFLIKKFSKPKLDIIPFDFQEMVLYFTPLLSWFKLGISIQCKRASCIVKRIETEITRLNDGENMHRRWKTFSPIWYNWAIFNNQLADLNSQSSVHPLKLDANSLYPIIISFEDTNPLAKTNLQDKIIECNYINKQQTEQTCKNSLKLAIENIVQELKDNMFWKEGQCKLTITVEYDLDKCISKNYYFNITKDIETRFNLNCANCVACNLLVGFTTKYSGEPVSLFQNPSPTNPSIKKTKSEQSKPAECVTCVIN